MVEGRAELFPGFDVSRETHDRLEAFASLVVKWSERINLISAASIPSLWRRHIVDSAQLFPLAGSNWAHWVDLGSGGGFPGIVLAVIAREKCPDGRFTLVESDQRKAVFLRTAIRELSLSANVLTERAEMALPLRADVLSARALGSLTDIVGLAARHLSSSGCAIFPKGRVTEEEISAARQRWFFDLKRLGSFTDQESEILLIRGITRA